MKKYFFKIFAAFAILTFHVVNGKQNENLSDENSKFEIGIHGAPTASIFYGVPTFKENFDIQYQLKLGFIAGVSLQYNLKPTFALASEINFERKGNMAVTGLTDDVGNFIGTVRQEYHADYLTVPLTVKYIFGQKKTKFFVNAGIYVGYLLAFGWHVLPIGPYPGFKYEDDPDNYERMDYGAVTGFGMNIPVKEHMLFSIEARNNLGLHKIIKGASYNDEYIKNESFTLLLGLIYKFKSKPTQPINQEGPK